MSSQKGVWLPSPGDSASPPRLSTLFRKGLLLCAQTPEREWGRRRLRVAAHLGEQAFHDRFGLDPILYLAPHRPNAQKRQYYDPDQGDVGFLESRRVVTDSWRIHTEPVDGRNYPATRWKIVTPRGTLTMVLASDA